MSSLASSSATPRLPLWLKIVYTLFMVVLIPCYWDAYGPTNFLYFCDVALFFTLAAMWLESPLLASMPAVGILVPQILWVVDFSISALGMTFMGMADYMFKDSIKLFYRGLSSFHGWLPFLLGYLVWRLGYDRRALLGWTLLSWALLLVCYFLMPAPPPDPSNPNRPVNINYVYGTSDDKAQTMMPGPAWFALLLVALPVVIFLPTHLALQRWFPAAEQAGASH